MTFKRDMYMAAKTRHFEVRVDKCIIYNFVFYIATEFKSLINATAMRRNDLFINFNELCNDIIT